jgi:hypothetical protein
VPLEQRIRPFLNERHLASGNTVGFAQIDVVKNNFGSSFSQNKP